MRKALGLAIAVSGLVVPGAFAQGGPMTVRVAKVDRQDVARGRSFLGTIEPFRTSVVGSPVQGRVLEHLVEYGDRVSQGQPLVRLRTTQLELQIEVAKAELEHRKRELEEVEHGSRPEEVEQARARVAAVDADVSYWKTKLERADELRRKGGMSLDELEDATVGYAKALADRDLARASLVLAEKGPRAEKIAQAKARVEVQADQIALLEDRLEEYAIKAPFDGYVIAERTEVGQWLNEGAPVVELAYLDQVFVTVGVPEEAIRHVDKGDAARIELPATPDRLITGVVEIVAPQADPRSRSVAVRIKVDNESGGGGPILKPGLSARVTLEVGEVRQALLVPKDALVLGGPTPMVYVVDGDPAAPSKGTARPVPVSLGIAHEGRVQVEGQIEAGQLVVVLGNERLYPGAAVVVLNPGVE